MAAHTCFYVVLGIGPRALDFLYTGQAVYQTDLTLQPRIGKRFLLLFCFVQLCCPVWLSAPQASEECWESLRSENRRRDTSLQSTVAGMQESSVPFLAGHRAPVTHPWSAGITPRQVPRARARAVPSARQDGARDPRLLFDLEGLFKCFPVCIPVLRHSVSQQVFIKHVWCVPGPVPACGSHPEQKPGSFPQGLHSWSKTLPFQMCH